MCFGLASTRATKLSNVFVSVHCLLWSYYKFPFYCTKVFRSTVFHAVFPISLCRTKVFDRLLSTRWGKPVEISQHVKARATGNFRLEANYLKWVHGLCIRTEICSSVLKHIHFQNWISLFNLNTNLKMRITMR